MGIFSKFEGKVDDAFDGMASSVFKSPIEPTQIAKRCEKQMHRNKLVGKGVQYAPTLYTVLVNVDDDRRLFGFYPTMAGELETYLVGAADSAGLSLECRPLVRFISDDGLKSGKFDVVAEVVTANIIAELREEEAEYYGLDTFSSPVRQPRQTRNPKGNRRPGGTARRQNYDAEPERHGRRSSHPHAHVEDDADFAGLDALDADFDDMSGRGGRRRPSRRPSAERDEYAGARHARDGYDDGYDPYDPYDPYEDDGEVFVGAHSAGNRYGFQGAVLVDAMSGEKYPIADETALIGREETCDIYLPDASISRAHARINRDDMGSWSIIDLDSTNGTAVNGRKIERSGLNFGDQITVGTTILLFQKG